MIVERFSASTHRCLDCDRPVVQVAHHWADDSLTAVLTFDRSMDQQSVEAALQVEPAVALDTTWEGGTLRIEVREPLVDVFDEESEIVIVAELAGVGEGEIQIQVHDDVLSLETTGERKYAKEILLTAPVNATTLQEAYKNGILELRLKKP